MFLRIFLLALLKYRFNFEYHLEKLCGWVRESIAFSNTIPKGAY